MCRWWDGNPQASSLSLPPSEGRLDRIPFVCPDARLMTFAAMHPRAPTHGPRRLNFLEPRDSEVKVTQTSFVPSSSPNAEVSPTSTSAANTRLPTSKTALAAVISVVGTLIILGMSFFVTSVIWDGLFIIYRRRDLEIQGPQAQ